MSILEKMKQIEPAVFAGGNMGEKPSKETIAGEIRKLVKKFGGDPLSINSGYCDRFAEELVSRLDYGFAMETVSDDIEDPDADMVDLPNHAFVQVDNRYYDAETPYGVAQWWDLPVYKRFDFRESKAATSSMPGNRPKAREKTFEEWLAESRRGDRIAPGRFR